jgi:glycosyltransferase involved in cell wall biosynthesis
MQLWKHLSQNGNKFNVVHLHSWWSILILGAAHICNKKGIPFILSPRGMLGRYSFAHQNNFLKRIMHTMWGKKLLQKSILHATSRKEWNDCVKIHPRWKGFILPNIVGLPVAIHDNRKMDHHIMTIGFLARIDHKKGLEYLFRALARVNFTYRFLIAGTGDDNYIRSLKELAEQLGIQQHLQWCGWMDVESKFQFLQQLDLFVLTSYNENFANTVVESLSVGCPVLVSRHVGLSDYVVEKKLGWVCDLNEDSITAHLHLIDESRAALKEIRKKAPITITHDFNPATLAEKYLHAYTTSLHLSEKIMDKV